MKRKEKITDKIVGEIVRKGSPGRVRLTDRGIVEDLYESSNDNSQQYKPGLLSRCWQFLLKWTWLRKRVLWLNVSGNKALRFSLVACTAFFMLVVTVWYAVFFISDVILYETDFQINEQGTINPKKALNSEYAMFLFNTSEVWCNPGVQINKKDRIKISISGGFQSSIEHVLDAAKDNKKPTYVWVSPGRSIANGAANIDTTVIYCLSRGDHLQERHWPYREHHFDYGTLMYTIQPESANIQDHPLGVQVGDIRAWTPHCGFRKANDTGYLYFSINDLFFGDKNDPGVSEKINNYYDPQLKQLYKKVADMCSVQECFDEKEALWEYCAWKKKEMEAEISSLETEKTAVSDDPFFLFKDNLGQLLVAVEIQRYDPSFWHWPEMSFRAFENKCCWFQDWLNCLRTKNKFFQFILSPEIVRFLIKALAYIVFFLLFGLENLGIFAVWTILFCISFCLICQLYRTIRKWMTPLFHGEKIEKTESPNE